MLAFDNESPDYGVSKYIERAGFTPDSVCALLFNPDFVHLHKGMDEEYTLFPDNCAYRAVLKNTERYRQDWTNYQLRGLIKELKANGVDFYVGLMGAYMEDRFHHEWLSDHPELRACKTNRSGNLMCLKRFKDGSYYEDFFAKKVVETLVDYDCAGLHLSDGFCPSHALFTSDYSTDMFGQFTDHTGISLREDIARTLGDDSAKAANIRQEYVWAEYRYEWISFWEWRWERFFKKICKAVHDVGKKVWILGMYCSDPFETKYVYGFDTKRVMDAGVDCITANILPSSVHFERPEYPYYFHRMHMDLPLLRTQVGDRQVVSMVSIHDASEEWSMIEHAPVRVERDVYTMTSFTSRGKEGPRPVADGVFLCLGDGVSADKWSFIKKRIDVGFDARVVGSYSPMVLWSDSAHEAMLGEYIEKRRTTPHKQSFEIFKAGMPLGGAVRSEYLGEIDEVLFVPNYDMLSDTEKEALRAYGSPWVGTVPVGTDISELMAEYVCTDRYSDYPMTAFLCGARLGEEKRGEIEELLAKDDGVPSVGDIPEAYVHPPIAELPYRKLSAGFVSACARLLGCAMYSRYPVKCNHPMMVHKLSDGRERIYVYNKHDNAYITALVESELPIETADVASTFPILPVKFVDSEDTSGAFDYTKASARKKCFQMKLAPDGLTIVDIRRKSNV